MFTKKTISATIFFFLTACVVALVWFLISSSCFPTFISGETVPQDWEHRSYAISNPPYDPSTGEFCIQLQTQNGHLPSILAGISVPFDLYCENELIYSYTPADPYTRLHLIELPAVATSGNTLNLRLKPAHNADIKLLLGSSDAIETGIAYTTNFYYFMYGVYIIIVLASLILYFGKRTELYTLLLAVYSAVCAFATFFTLNTPVFNASFDQYSPFRAWLFLMTNLLGVIVCFLIPDVRMFHLKNLKPWQKAGVTAAVLFAVFAAFFAEEQLLNFLADFVFLFGVYALVRAYRQGSKCSLFLLFGYALSHGLRLVWFLSNKGILPNSPLLVYIRLPLFDNLPFLMGCMVVVLKRFASKFKEAVALNDELTAVNASLDQRIWERTNELKQQEEKKHNMMTNIFHDLRNPIFAIQGCLDMMDLSSAQNQRFHSIIKERLQVMNNLVENLFFVSKLEEGKITFVNERQDFSALCAECILAEAPKAHRKKVQLESHIEPEVVIVGDAFRLKQAIGNLIQNALEHTNESGVVSVTLLRQGDTAVLHIQDTGEGIAAKDLPYLFHRYYTPNLSDSQKSSGLGLAIANEIVRAQGGTIHVESQIGVGSDFALYFPLFDPKPLS